MNSLTAAKIQFAHLLRFYTGKNRFADISAPWSKARTILDKDSGKCLKLKIRDLDDWLQIENIFLCEEYNLAKTARSHQIDMLHLKIIESGRKPLIVDIGANIGLASGYFNLKYPGSRILAIEPDNSNLELAENNVIGDCQLVSAAVSAYQGLGNLLPTGRIVGFRVCSDPSGSVIFETVESLLRNGKGCVRTLKVDGRSAVSHFE